MKTTIDIPEPLYRKAKIQAVEPGRGGLYVPPQISRGRGFPRATPPVSTAVPGRLRPGRLYLAAAHPGGAPACGERVFACPRQRLPPCRRCPPSRLCPRARIQGNLLQRPSSSRRRVTVWPQRRQPYPHRVNLADNATDRLPRQILRARAD